MIAGNDQTGAVRGKEGGSLGVQVQLKANWLQFRVFDLYGLLRRKLSTCFNLLKKSQDCMQY